MLIGIVNSINGKTIKALIQASNPPVKKMTMKQIATGKLKAKTLTSNILK